MSGAMRVLRAGDHVSMPWKNGGGVTVEIAVEPPGASLEAFGWRVSMASVARDGPFSLFAGIERTLAVLGGNGLRLSVGGEAPRHLTRSSAPFSFAADVPAHAALVDGPITDLNVMTRRGVWRHGVRRIAGGGSLAVAPDAPMWLLLCHGGPCRLEASSRAIELSPGDALLGAEPAAGLTARTDAGLFRIEFWPVGARPA